MSDDIRAGDVVVCVDARTPNRDGIYPNGIIAEGRLYRVEGVYQGTYVPACHLAGLHSGTLSGGFRLERFRKIDAADDKFIADMRALKPIPVAAGYGQKVVVR